MRANQVIEVLIISPADNEHDAEILYGPKPYVARDTTSAIAQAVRDAVNDGIAVDADTDIRTRFFG